jgi:hypothetical protein
VTVNVTVSPDLTTTGVFGLIEPYEVLLGVTV